MELNTVRINHKQTETMDISNQRENVSSSPIYETNTNEIVNMDMMTETENLAVNALVTLHDYDNYSISSEDTNDYNYNKMDYDDDGNTGYFEMRVNDTLAGWTYSCHPNSICLTPPSAWHYTPYAINVQWYKRPLFYSDVHKGYFISNSPIFVSKVEELGAIHNQDRVWE